MNPLWKESGVTEINFKKFPRVDVLYLSHRHQDHFDVRTLAFLKRSDILSSDFFLSTSLTSGLNVLELNVNI